MATDRSESLSVTTTALREILPMLKAHGLKAMVEPLGFAVCSLRYKDVLAQAIEELWAGQAPISWCMTRSIALAGLGRSTRS